MVDDVYYDYNETLKITQNLCRKYNYLDVYNIGRTYCGREIRLLKLGKARECVLYCAAMHGNESITTTILLKLIEDICECIAEGKLLSGINIKRMMKARSFAFIPMSNPDGCEIALKGDKADVKNIEAINKLCSGEFRKWKANGRGVDINRNFQADWEKTSEISKKYGFSSPSYMKYCGEYPESEAETLAIVNACKLLNPCHIVSLHTQGEVIFYGWKKSKSDEARMANILSMLSGYSVEIPEELSQGGGFKDWFSKTYRRPGFTIECGKGENPLPESDISKIYKRIFEMLAVSLIM